MAPERIVVIGAGAIGASTAALLVEVGVTCVLVARGETATTIANDGVQLRFPTAARSVRVPVVRSLAEASPTKRDLVVLATMGHHTATALAGLDPTIAVASFQNGTTPLDAIAQRGHPTLAAMLYVPAERRGPGVVALPGVPVPGAILLGAWPRGEGTWSAWLVDRLVAAGFRAEVERDIAPWVRAKLLVNLGGIVVAVCDEPADDVVLAAQAEARAVWTARGERFEEVATLLARLGAMSLAPVDGRERKGGSTRAALARGEGVLETETLHASIVDAGKATGIATPVNDALIAIAAEAGRDRWTAGALDATELRRRVLTP